MSYQSLKLSQENQQLEKVELSQEASVVLAFKHRVFNRDRLLKKLKRANADQTKEIFIKTHIVSKGAAELAEIILNKIFSGKRVLLNHKYISKITECESTNQNKRILDQLANLFQIKYHRLAIVNNIPFNYHYSFELNPSIAEELKDTELWDKKFMPPFLGSSYNNIPNSFNKENRSNESNFNLDSNISIPSIKQAETKKIVSSKRFIQNSRKKSTNSERKARVLEFYKKNQYKTPKALCELEPITKEECAILQAASGREFTLRAQNQILKSMWYKDKCKDARFLSRQAFIRYFTESLRCEKRDAVATSGANFTIKANQTTEENMEYTSLNQRETYLSNVEQRAITHRSGETQYRAKIAGGQISTTLACNFLTSLISIREMDTVLELKLVKNFLLTENFKEFLLEQANTVGEYDKIERLKFVK